ncbi:uncharacterized protein J3R85_001107 [Psidium guajava]|nr:uncharacterized protein J3R85_001107 [Psidium guajava]
MARGILAGSRPWPPSVELAAARPWPANPKLELERLERPSRRKLEDSSSPPSPASLTEPTRSGRTTPTTATDEPKPLVPSREPIVHG